ncbi:hypothetical protein MD484_g2379, partial [Candolleomyces efflorescens]
MQANALDGFEVGLCSPTHTWHQSLLSSLHDGTPIDSEMLGPEYVEHIFKTPGPSFAIPAQPISTPSAKTLDFAYFDSPTEDPLLDVDPDAQYTSVQDRLAHGHRGLVDSRQVSVARPTAKAKVFRVPVTPSPSSHPYEDLNFRWTKFDRNDIVVGLPSSAARHRPIYQLDDITASSDVDNGSDVASSLLLGRSRSRQDSSRLATQSAEANWDAFTTPTLPRRLPDHDTSVEIEENCTALREHVEGHTAASVRLEEQFTPTPLPSTPVKPSQIHGDVESFKTPSQNMPERRLVSEFTVPREDSMCAGSAGGMESALVTPESTLKPKLKPAFAPAPGIYISPLRGSNTKETAKDKNDVCTSSLRRSHDTEG